MASSALRNAMKIRNISIERAINSILQPLTDKQTAIRLSMKALSVLSENINANNAKHRQDIESYFNTIIKQIQSMKERCCSKINLISQKKQLQIAKHRELLSKDEKIITDALKECKLIMTGDRNLNANSQKKQKVQSLSNKILNSLKEPISLKINDKIKYALNGLSNSSSSSLCVIEDDILSPLPSINNLKCDCIKDRSARILWTAMQNQKQLQTSKISMLLRIKCIDLDDEKEREYVVLFDQLYKNEYIHKLDGLQPNKQYVVSLHVMESNVKRTDFERICIEFRTKRQGAKESEYKFERGGEHITVSDDGLSVIGHGQIRFGPYLNAQNGQILKVWLSMKDVESGQCGIGFATKGFTIYHNNHRMLVYGNKKVLMSKEFTHGQDLAMRYWEKGEVVLMEVNMKKRIGKMYRQTMDQQGIQVIDEFYKVNLPETVAICVRLGQGKEKQSLTVIKQQIID